MSSSAPESVLLDEAVGASGERRIGPPLAGRAVAVLHTAPVSDGEIRFLIRESIY